MSNTQWPPLNPAVIEAAWEARERGLSLRAVAAELAAKGMQGPSARPYLPGSIANMLRFRTSPADAVDVTQQPLTEPTPQPEPLTECSAQPVDDPPAELFAVFDALEQPAAPLADLIVDCEPEPQPIVDAAPAKPRWEPRRDHRGLVDFHSLIDRLREISEPMQQAAMWSAGLRVEQMVDLIDRADHRETVANWLHWHT